VDAGLEKAFVKEDDLYLDPTLIEKTAIERMPDPAGWRILVLIRKKSTKTEGGIELLQQTVDKESLATMCAWVVKKGPLCYNDKEKYGEKHWCEENQWVLIGRYAGARFRVGDGIEVRIINDDDVIGTILDPDDIETLQ
jgi:co-chaperonin GroES (HSP10)